MEQVKEMFDVIQFVRRELDELANLLTPEDKARRGSLQEWSAKDMLAHLAFWGSHFNRQLEKMLEGKKVPVAGDYFNQVNDGVLYAHLDQPFEEALAEEAAAYRKFLEIMEKIPAIDLTDPQRYTFLEGHMLLERVLGNHAYHPTAHVSDYYAKNGREEKARTLQETLTERLCVFPIESQRHLQPGCYYSLNGLKEEAIEKLKVAFEAKPDLVEWSLQDSDMDPLRELAEYQALVGK